MIYGASWGEKQESERERGRESRAEIYERRSIRGMICFKSGGLCFVCFVLILQVFRMRWLSGSQFVAEWQTDIFKQHDVLDVLGFQQESLECLRVS